MVQLTPSLLEGGVFALDHHVPGRAPLLEKRERLGGGGAHLNSVENVNALQSKCG